MEVWPDLFGRATAAQPAGYPSGRPALSLDRDLAGQPVELCRHNEIVLVQTFDLLGAQRDRGIAPPEANIRMMEFRLGEFTGAAHESKGIAKAPEPVGAFDPRRLVPQHPFRCLHAIRFRLLDRKRRHAAAAWRAGLLGQ